MPALLIFGHDAILLDSRAMLLRSRGYRVFPVSQASEIEGVTSAVGLLILCHTLGEHDCASALELATNKWPGVQSIALVSCGRPSYSSRMRSVQTWEGPAKLIAVVDECMGPPGSRAA